MALLGPGALLLAAFLGVGVAHGSIPPRSHEIHRGAVQALKNCDRKRASFWAKELERSDPEQAVLYRLAWLEAQLAPEGRQKERVDANDWAWKADAEVWSDEAGALVTSCSPSKRQRPALFSELPPSVLSDLLLPYIAKYSSVRPALREALRNFVLYEWLQGHRLLLPSGALPQGVTLAESCEWRALQALHGALEDPKSLGDLARTCESPNRLLWAIVKVRAGDHLVKQGRADLAFAAFQSAIGFMPERALPKALAYRVAVTGALSGAADDIVLRSAYLALAEASGATSSLPPLLKSSIQNLVCARLDELQPSGLVIILRRVFEPQALIAGTARLTESCADSQVAGIWSALLSEVRLPQEKGRVYGLLLGFSIVRDDAQGRLKYAGKLAELSHSTPHLASHAFWSAIQRSGQVGERALQATIASYRKRAAWLPSDELRLKLLLRKKGSSAFKESANPLRLSSNRVDSVLELPFAALAAPLAIQDEIPSGFTSLLEKDLSL